MVTTIICKIVGIIGETLDFIQDESTTDRLQIESETRVAKAQEEADEAVEAHYEERSTQESDALRERILDLRKQGKIRDVPAGEYTVDEFFRRATWANVKPTITKTPL